MFDTKLSQKVSPHHPDERHVIAAFQQAHDPSIFKCTSLEAASSDAIPALMRGELPEECRGILVHATQKYRYFLGIFMRADIPAMSVKSCEPMNISTLLNTLKNRDNVLEGCVVPIKAARRHNAHFDVKNLPTVAHFMTPYTYSTLPKNEQLALFKP